MLKLRGLQERVQVALKPDSEVKSGKTKNGVEIPSNVKFYHPKEGRNKIVIVPFEIKTEKFPTRGGEPLIGIWDIVLDLHIHRNIQGKDYPCLRLNYNKPCPVCEEGYRLRKILASNCGI